MPDSIHYPGHLQTAEKEGTVVMLDVTGYPTSSCLCGGLKLLYYFQIEGKMSPTPLHKKCKWIDDGPQGSGWYPGQIEVVDCPMCASGNTQKYLADHCGLEGADLEISLTTFSTRGPLANKQLGYDTVAEILAMNRQMAGFYTLWGSYGVGKSHLMKATVNGARAVGLLANYTTVSDLIDSIRSRFGDDKGMISVPQAIDAYRHTRVLVIDEIDKLNPTPWALETLNRLIDYRYRSSEHVLTMIGTNWDLADKENGVPPNLGYLSSRMRGGTCIEIPGPDMRPALAPKPIQGRL